MNSFDRMPNCARQPDFTASDSDAEFIRPPAKRSAVIDAFLTGAGLIPAAEFAELMGWSSKTEAAQRSRRNTPPFIRKGAAIFYRYGDVTDWLHGTKTNNVNDVIAYDLLK